MIDKDKKQEDSSSKKSKRKNKQAKKGKHEEAETEIKSTDEDLSSKVEKNIEILSTGSSIPTPDTPKEILQIEEKILNVTIPEQTIEVNDILTIDEIKKDEKEIKNTI